MSGSLLHQQKAGLCGVNMVSGLARKFVYAC